MITTTSALDKITPLDVRKGRSMPRGINIWFSYDIYQTDNYVFTNVKYQFGEYFFVQKLLLKVYMGRGGGDSPSLSLVNETK